MTMVVQDNSLLNLMQKLAQPFHHEMYSVMVTNNFPTKVSFRIN